MKSITGYWSKCDRAGEVVKVIIKDVEAMEACNRNGTTDWTVPMAVRSFNAILREFGFEITRVEHWIGDEFS